MQITADICKLFHGSVIFINTRVYVLKESRNSQQFAEAKPSLPSSHQPPLALLMQMNQVNHLPLCFFKIIVPITLLSTLSSLKSPLSFWVSNQTSKSTCSPFCESHALSHPSHFASFCRSKSIWLVGKRIFVCICYVFCCCSETHQWICRDLPL
jgi:hypothetical protein